jgi:FAD synthetase
LISIFPQDLPAFPVGKDIVLVGGVFDLIHIGHLEFLKAAKEQGDYLVVALESEAIVLNNKKRNPVHTQEERAQILSHFDFVDHVIILPHMNGYEDYAKLVEAVRPKVIAVTEGEPFLEEKKRQASLVGGKVVSVIGRLAGYSTSDILANYGFTN